MMIRINKYIICLIILFALPLILHADAFERGTLGNARSIGIGAITAQCGGAYSVFINPAGLAKMRMQELSLSGADIYEGLDFGSVFRINAV